MFEIIEITDYSQLGEFLERRKSGVVAFDIETTGLNPRKDKILSFAVGDNEEVAFCEDPSFLERMFKDFSTYTYIAHNYKFEANFLYNLFGKIRLFKDTMLIHHLLDENQDHDLGHIVKSLYDDDYKKEFWSKYKTIEDAPHSELVRYNCKDVYYTFKAWFDIIKRLKMQQVPDSLVEHTHELSRCLLQTEIEGLAIDTPYLVQKGLELKTLLDELEPKMRSLVADELEIIENELWLDEIGRYKTPARQAKVQKPKFNFGSSKQLNRLLYVILGLPVQYNEKTKNPSTDYDALVKLKDSHPLCDLLLQFREKQKVYTAFIEGTLEKMENNRIYPSFNVNGTATGRISHSNPNLGQLPREGGIRGMYVPEPGNVFISADYSSLEVCISADITRDKNLMSIVLEGKSQHDITAEALGIERQNAKTLNFAMQYGCSTKKVSKILGCTDQEATKAFDKYWLAYIGQKQVMDECKVKVDRGEPIVNVYGRRRRFEKKLRKEWDSAYRQSWNALVQGTGADITSEAFYIADKRLRAAGIGRALFTVHDEILITCKKDAAEQAQKILVDSMVEVGKLRLKLVPLKAEASGAMVRWED